MQELACMYLYLTDACNLQCAHCWQSAPLLGPSRFSRLRFEECRAFLDLAVGLGLRSVTLSGGEPLLNRDWARFAEYCSMRKIRCAIETNGTLLDDRSVALVADFGAYCALSLDGASADSHRKTRRSDDAFDRTCRGIERLERAGCRYQLIMAMSHLNKDDLWPLADRIAVEWPHCDMLKVNFVAPEGRAAQLARDQMLLTPDEVLRVVDEVERVVGRYPFKIGLHLSPAFFTPGQLRKRYNCGGQCGYHHALSVLADGSVSICSLGKLRKTLVLGHVRTIALQQAWVEHPALRDLHESTHARLKGVCGVCVFRRGCLGACRAAALSAYGDYFGPYPACQSLFESGRFPIRWLVPGCDEEQAHWPAAQSGARQDDAALCGPQQASPDGPPSPRNDWRVRT